MSRLDLERLQLPIHFAALVAGGFLGILNPEFGGRLEPLLWPLLGLLLYATFSQVPLDRLGEALGDRRFLSALLVANFLVVPPMVWLLSALLLDDPVLVLGVLLVMLVPCTDWFLTFTYLGRGDLPRAIAATPVLLLGQVVLLPLYLLLMLGPSQVLHLDSGAMLRAFALIILPPLLLAWLTEFWARNHRTGRSWVRLSGWLPIPVLALVLALIAATQADALTDTDLAPYARVLMLFAAYFLLMPVLTARFGPAMGLGVGPARTLVFSVCSRNSFVVLPLALALAEPWRGAVTVIVLQILVELTALLLLIWWVPRYLLPGEGGFRPRGESRRGRSSPPG